MMKMKINIMENKAIIIKIKEIIKLKLDIIKNEYIYRK